MALSSKKREGKVLIIVRYFIPYSHQFGGIVRVLKLAEFLTDKGFQIYILTAKGNHYSYFGYKRLLKKFHISYIKTSRFFLKKTDANHISDNKHLDKLYIKLIKSVILFNKNLVTMLRRIITELFLFPDQFVIQNGKYCAVAQNLIQKENIKNVIISSPPFSTQLIGLQLKKKFRRKINLIVDYRDSWNLGLHKKNILLQPVNEFLEEKVLKNTDFFTYVTQPMLKKINRKYFDISQKSVLVRNGYDSRMKIPFSQQKKRRKLLFIGHFGSLGGTYRKPDDLFKALLKFDTKAKIIHYGSTSISSRSQRSLSGIFEVHSAISHQEALKKMQEMDILLLIHSEKVIADEMIPGKFYEYVRSQKPILVVGPSNTLVAEIVKKNHLGYIMDITNETDIIDKMYRILDDWKNNRLLKYDMNNFKEYQRQYQYEKILPLLNK